MTARGGGHGTIEDISDHEEPAGTTTGSVDEQDHADDHNESDHIQEREFEPLLHGAADQEPISAHSVTASLEGLRQPRIEETKSTWYLFLLTICMGGLQIAWSVELSSISPFLLSLGLSKSLLALVWIAGPLSGTLVQPYVGIRSDSSRSRWGRRRPFMIGGAVATLLSLVLLAWTREIIDGILGIFGVAKDSRGTIITSQIFATLLVYVLDFAINVIQAGMRAFIVDNVPTHQQEDANSWANRFAAVGNIAGYSSGYLDLPRYLPFFGNTQFKVLVVITCFVMSTTLAISCLSVPENDPNSYGKPAKGATGVISFFKELWVAVNGLPLQIKRVCQVQIFAWIGWFPFLFYVTTYVGGLYAEPYFEDDPNRRHEEVEDIWERGTRVGTFSLLIFSTTTFAASVLLPFIIAQSYKPLGAFREASSNGRDATNKFSCVDRSSFSGSLARLKIPYLTLRRAWLLSHIFFFFCMWLTFFVHDTVSATVLVGMVGIPWALTNWAPFALIAAEISKRDAIRRGLRPPPPTAEGRELAAEGREGRPPPAAEQAGVVLGIHNVAVAAPQVISTVVSSIIFHFLQRERGTPGDDSVAWTLRFGGLCALGAAWCAGRVGEGDADEQPLGDDVQ